MTSDVPTYWYSRFVFERALALLYLGAFVGAVNQFVPLLGARGLLPISRFTASVPFGASPSLFYLWHTDLACRVAAWTGVVISALLVAGLPQARGALAAGAAWAVLWVLYLSFVNVGQIFYAFGWETLLLEAGFFAIFLGGRTTPPHRWMTWIWAWLLFRVMFGAGLIKLRGDACWRDLTCLDYYFETQPIPNALSWYFHWMPAWIHRAGVIFNHIAELIVPFAYFAPQPWASAAALVTIVFQLALIVSGNLSWLNWLTLALCLPLLDDRWWSWLPIDVPALAESPSHRVIVAVVAVGTVILSVRPALNLLSPRQMMNASFNPLHLVNTYGAFGSITRVRHEIVLEGTDAAVLGPGTVWRTYEFKGKPGDPMRRPPQIAPYHLRLDWLMWFAAMSPAPGDRWFFALADHLLAGDPATLGLLRTNPFPDAPPRFLRARYYRYRFTTPAEHRRTGAWWSRELIGPYGGQVLN